MPGNSDEAGHQGHVPAGARVASRGVDAPIGVKRLWEVFRGKLLEHVGGLLLEVGVASVPDF